MQWINRIRQVKIVLVVLAVVLSVASLVVSNFLVRDLKKEEHRKMEIWAEAMRSYNNADENTDLALVWTVLGSNNTIPVQDYRNMEVPTSSSAPADSLVLREALSMKQAGRSIRIDLGRGSDYMEICYADSLILRRLAWWPYAQLGVVLIFVVVAIFALLSSKKAEQNKVWVGLSKETAHQLGTPISSLMAWHEVLRETYPDDPLLPEMGKDVQRLQRIAERFSKIGSQPEPKPENLGEVLQGVMQYIGRRTSNRITIHSHLPAAHRSRQCPPLRMGHREPLQERHRCNGRTGRHHPDGQGRARLLQHRGQRYGQGHPQEPLQFSLHSGLHHEGARMGARTVACQAHRRGVSSRTYLRQELRTRERHNLPS